MRRGLAFTDLLVFGSFVINYFNYRQNVKQAQTSKKIADNLEKINGSKVLEKLCVNTIKQTPTP